MSAKLLVYLSAFLLSYAASLFCAYKAGQARGKAQAYRDSSEQIRKALCAD